MSRASYLNLVEQIYLADPGIPDAHVKVIVYFLGGKPPSQKTMDYWKTQCRKRGVAIPDKRRSKC